MRSRLRRFALAEHVCMSIVLDSGVGVVKSMRSGDENIRQRSVGTESHAHAASPRYYM